jgi:hypothetical protein
MERQLIKADKDVEITELTLQNLDNQHENLK